MKVLKEEIGGAIKLNDYTENGGIKRRREGEELH